MKKALLACPLSADELGAISHFNTFIGSSNWVKGFFYKEDDEKEFICYFVYCGRMDKKGYVDLLVFLDDEISQMNRCPDRIYEPPWSYFALVRLASEIRSGWRDCRFVYVDE